MELFAADGHDADGCERVTGKSGMRPFRVAMLWIDDATVIDTLEARLIRATSPPLNTAGVSNANTKQLKQLRKVLATTSTTSTGAAISTLAKGTRIGVTG